MKRLFMLLAAGIACNAAATYKCVDEKGTTLIGDTPPEGCAKVVIYELSRSGQVIRKIDPTPSPDQLKALRDGAEQRKLEQRRAAEQKRLDDALLNTYASEREFDMTRDRNIEPINARIKIAKDRIVAVDKRTREIEDELEFYKAGKSKAGKTREAPANLVQDLDRMKKERVALEKSIAGYEKEVEATRAKYDNDKKRWVALKNPPDDKAQPAKAPAR